MRLIISDFDLFLINIILAYSVGFRVLSCVDVSQYFPAAIKLFSETFMGHLIARLVHLRVRP